MTYLITKSRNMTDCRRLNSHHRHDSNAIHETKVSLRCECTKPIITSKRVPCSTLQPLAARI